MSSRFLTLEKSHPDFFSHITGRFSEAERAVPEKSFGIGTPGERVTFRLIPVEDIVKPGWPVIVLLALRPSYLTLSLGPVAVTVALLLSQGWQTAWGPLGLALAALMFFHFSVFLFNDYYDHVHGQDRMNPKRGSQIIQKGWEPAFRIKQWAVVNLAIGTAIGCYLAFQSSAFLFLIGAVALATVLLFPWLRDLKSGPFAELLIFVCFGPLLVYGFLTAIQAPADMSLLLASGAFGGLAVVCVHLKYLENIFQESMSGSQHLLARWGLDKGRKLVMIEIVLTAFWLIGWFYAFPVKWSWIPALICLLPAFWLLKKVSEIGSPMSSSLKGLTQWGLLCHWGLSIFMTLVFTGIFVGRHLG